MGLLSHIYDLDNLANIMFVDVKIDNPVRRLGIREIEIVFELPSVVTHLWARLITISKMSILIQ